MRQTTIYEALTFDQKKRLWDYLVSIGLPQQAPKRAPRKSKTAGLKAWKPETAAGRACKASMLRWAKLPPIEGVKSYQVLGADGRYYSEGDEGFAEAIAYRKLQDAKELSNRKI